MNIALRYIALILMVSMCSCRGNAQNKSKDPVMALFPKQSIHLTAVDPVSLEDYDIFFVTRIHAYKDWLILNINAAQKANLIAFFNPNTKEIFEGAPRGRGPGELVSASTSQIVGNRLYLYGRNEAQFISIDLDKSVETRRVQVETEAENSFRTNMELPLSVALLKGGFVIGTDTEMNNDSTWYSVYDFNGNKKSSVPITRFKETDDRLTKFQKRQLNILTSNIVASPDQKHVVASAGGFGALSFSKIEGDNVQEIKRYVFGKPNIIDFKNLTERSVIILESDDSYINLSSSKIMNDYLYIIYSLGAAEDEEYNSKTKTTLLTFDLNGEPIKWYELDRSITVIELSKDRKVLWGLNNNDPRLTLYRFEIQ